MTSQQATSASGAAGTSFGPASSDMKQQIEQRLRDFTDAWNRHDASQMASMWAEEGDLINPWGRLASGRDQVEQLLREEHQGPMKSSRHQISVSSVRLLGNDIAIVDATCDMKGVCSAEGREMPAFNPHLVLVMQKREGNWQALAARPYAFAPQPGKGN